MIIVIVITITITVTVTITITLSLIASGLAGTTHGSRGNILYYIILYLLYIVRFLDFYVRILGTKAVPGNGGRE